MNILKIDQKKLSKTQLNIDTFSEAFMQNIQSYRTKNGHLARVKEFGKNNIPFDALIQVNTFSQTTLQPPILLIKVSDVNLRTGMAGYILQIEKVISPIINSNLTQTHTTTAHLQFKIDPHLRLYYAELVSGSSQTPKDQSDLDTTTIVFHSNLPETYRTDNLTTLAEHLSKSYHQPSFHHTNVLKNEDLLQASPPPPSSNQLNHEKQDYARGIKCVRLIANKMIDIDEFRIQEEEQEEELQEDSQHIDSSNKRKNISFNPHHYHNTWKEQLQENIIENQSSTVGSVFLKKEKFTKFINESKFLESNGMNGMKIYSTIFIIISAILSLANFFIISDELQQANQRYQYLSSSNQLTADGQIILAKIQELYFINKVPLIP